MFLFIPEKAQRANQDFFSVGLKIFLHALSPKRFYSCNTLPWRGATSHFAHVALLPFVSLPWKQGHCILLYMESIEHIHFRNASVYWGFFSVQRSKGDVLLDQFVMLLDFLLSSNLVNHYYFVFLTDRELLLASLLTGPSPLIFLHDYLDGENQALFLLKKGCPNLEIHAPTIHCNGSPAAFPLQRHKAIL